MSDATIQANDARMTVIGKNWPDVPSTSGSGDWDNTYDGTYDGEIPRTDLPVRIEVTIPPAKLRYNAGERISLDGIEVRAYYADDSEWGIVPVNKLMLKDSVAGESPHPAYSIDFFGKRYYYGKGNVVTKYHRHLEYKYTKYSHNIHRYSYPYIDFTKDVAITKTDIDTFYLINIREGGQLAPNCRYVEFIPRFFDGTGPNLYPDENLFLLEVTSGINGNYSPARSEDRTFNKTTDFWRYYIDKPGDPREYFYMAGLNANAGGTHTTGDYTLPSLNPGYLNPDNPNYDIPSIEYEKDEWYVKSDIPASPDIYSTSTIEHAYNVENLQNLVYQIIKSTTRDMVINIDWKRPVDGVTLSTNISIQIY